MSKRKFPVLQLIKIETHELIFFNNLPITLVLGRVDKEVYWAVLPPPSTAKANYSFVTGQRGAPKILYDGFSYICAKHCNERKYWVCAKQRSRNCKARLITGRDGNLEVSRNVYHNHGPEMDAASTDKVFVEFE